MTHVDDQKGSEELWNLQSITQNCDQHSLQPLKVSPHAPHRMVDITRDSSTPKVTVPGLSLLPSYMRQIVFALGSIRLSFNVFLCLVAIFGRQCYKIPTSEVWLFTTRTSEAGNAAKNDCANCHHYQTLVLHPSDLRRSVPSLQHDDMILTYFLWISWRCSLPMRRFCRFSLIWGSLPANAVQNLPCWPSSGMWCASGFKLTAYAKSSWWQGPKTWDAKMRKGLHH